LQGRTPWLDYEVRQRPRWGHGLPPHQELYDIIDGGRTGYAALAESAAAQEGLRSVPLDASPGRGARWNQDMLPSIDAAVLYTIVCTMPPARYVEVGSGESTKFVRRAIEDHELPTTLISVDPQPRDEVDALCDRIVRQPVEDLDLSFFDVLVPGDVVFIDGSHRVFMNSDVTTLWLDVLPRLSPGVVVHVHDVFLPYDYPPDWIKRFYSEQYMVAASLLAGRGLEIVFPSYFVARDAELVRLFSPLWEAVPVPMIRRTGASLWVRVGGESR
jgi:hypothetical protein